MIDMRRSSDRGLFVAYSKAPRRDRIMQFVIFSALATIVVFVLFVQVILRVLPISVSHVVQMRDGKNGLVTERVEFSGAPNRTQIWPDPEILANNAIANRLIVAAVNCGYLDFVDNWLASLEALGITNYILIALDQNAYDVLMQTYPEHTILSFAASAENKPAEAVVEDPDPKARNYGSQEFGNVVRSRPLLLLPFLKQGYTIFYSDIDTYWMKNPFDEIRQGDYDLQGATDSHPESPDDDIGDHNICTGMLYLEATYPTIRLLENWHKILVEINADVNQASFSDALHKWNNEADKNHNVRIKYKIAERDAYPPGYMYFKNDARWKNKDTYVPKRSPVIVHANWVVGKKAKRKMLKDSNLWKPKGILKPCKVENK